MSEKNKGLSAIQNWLDVCLGVHWLRDQDLYHSNLFIYEFTGLVTSLMVKHGWCRDMRSFGPKKTLVDISHSLTESLRHPLKAQQVKERHGL